MIYLLDTDHVSLLDRGGVEGQAIRTRLSQVPGDDVSAGVISFEEQMRGWMSVIAQAKTAERQIPFYYELQSLLRFYCNTPMFPFGVEAVTVFNQLQRQRVRIGTMDVKIASIALANNATLLTRNLSHFHKVPGLRAEDWSTAGEMDIF